MANILCHYVWNEAFKVASKCIVFIVDPNSFTEFLPVIIWIETLGYEYYIEIVLYASGKRKR